MTCQATGFTYGKMLLTQSTCTTLKRVTAKNKCGTDLQESKVDITKTFTISSADCRVKPNPSSVSVASTVNLEHVE